MLLIPLTTIFFYLSLSLMVYLAIHLKWIQSSLENRMQQRPVHGSLSDSRVLTCFVPQGIILGPHLSLLLINDLPNCLSHCEPRMYADDTYLTYADNNVGSIESSLSEGLLNVNTWLNANKLTLNMTKTIYADRIWPKTFYYCYNYPLNVIERYSGEICRLQLRNV